MNTGGTLLTNAGRNMISDSIMQNKSIYITKAKLGTGDTESIEISKELADLVKVHREAEINEITRDKEFIKIRVIFENNNEVSPVIIKEYGIYGKLGEEGAEVLIAYSNDDPGQYMPAGGTQNIVEYQKDVYIGVSEDAVVIATIDKSLIYATKEDLPELVTQISDGLMLSTDKKKLDGIETGANKYILPTATTTVLGGVKLDTTLSNWIKSLFSVATQAANGLMSLTDKKKLDEIETGANKYVLPTATSTVLGGVRLDTTLSNWIKSLFSVATQAANGLMSLTDKKKLDGIDTGANKYALPTATSTVSGGIKIGNDFEMINGSLNPGKTIRKYYPEQKIIDTGITVNLDNYVTPGIFSFIGNITNGNVIGNPFPGKAITLEVDTSHSGDPYINHKVTSYMGNDVAIRYKIPSGWGTWNIILTDSKSPIPVGGVLILTTGVNPSTLYPGTTWMRLAANRNIRGCAEGGGAGATGGSDTVTLTTNNMPPHSHAQTAHSHTRGTMEISGGFKPEIQDSRGMLAGFSGAFYGTGLNVYGGAAVQHNYPSYFYQSAGFQASKNWTGATSSIAPTIASAGSGVGFSVVNAYMTLHIWERRT